MLKKYKEYRFSIYRHLVILLILLSPTTLSVENFNWIFGFLKYFNWIIGFLKEFNWIFSEFYLLKVLYINIENWYK
jgi:hypothetical protein